jgi:hypothetical protein
MTDKEAMAMALDALEACHIYGGLECVMTPDSAIYLHPAITAIKEALAEHAMQEVQRLGQEIEQEPVAHCKVRPLRGDESFPKVEIDWVNHPIPGPLYTTPPQRTERNFCERCGKRTKDIHTCTPPNSRIKTHESTTSISRTNVL